ncbi:hypothetical protein FZD47_25260 [Bacillus infantis]|uniref:Uncharacterized protein n=1 Tax=Bacillus infantis TaxID=324767 RepID=A0A5D4RYI9_9BACI|nr:hypothetical protein [Bacillus infantis]TYS55739.1 hypothetical protein FZD47_25260 [Bacillus infantis]
MNINYLNRIAKDISERAKKILINDSIELEIKSIELNGSSVKVWTKGITGIARVSNIKLLDETDQVISERNSDLEVYASQYISFSFEYEAKAEVVTQ